MTKTKTTATQPKIKDVRLCTNETCSDEAIYVDGKLKAEQETFYMWEVGQIVGRRPVKFRNHNVDLGDRDRWPKRFSDLNLLD